jgi:hypothetical protein
MTVGREPAAIDRARARKMVAAGISDRAIDQEIMYSDSDRRDRIWAFVLEARDEVDATPPWMRDRTERPRAALDQLAELERLIEDGERFRSRSDTAAAIGARKAQAERRAADARVLRAAGLTVSKIADKLGDSAKP